MNNIHQYWVYILSNKTRSVLYIGVTNNLYKRFIEHKTGTIPGFTEKYKCHYLIYFEEYQDINEAIAREKELKGWTRNKKEELIRRNNPLLNDLAQNMGWNNKQV